MGSGPPGQAIRTVSGYDPTPTPHCCSFSVIDTIPNVRGIVPLVPERSLINCVMYFNRRFSGRLAAHGILWKLAGTSPVPHSEVYPRMTTIGRLRMVLAFLLVLSIPLAVKAQTACMNCYNAFACGQK
jgi:hypothetical protein